MERGKIRRNVGNGVENKQETNLNKNKHSSDSERGKNTKSRFLMTSSGMNWLIQLFTNTKQI